MVSMGLFPVNGGEQMLGASDAFVLGRVVEKSLLHGAVVHDTQTVVLCRNLSTM